MLDAYNMNKEETEIREAKQLDQPMVIQRLSILKETVEAEYLEKEANTEKDSQPEETVIWQPSPPAYLLFLLTVCSLLKISFLWWFVYLSACSRMDGWLQ